VQVLSATERADLASFLLVSLGKDEIDDHSYRTEIAQRIAAIRSGQAIGMPLEDVLAGLRETKLSH